MEWKDLSILDKSKWILFFVSQGITNKLLMQELYDLGINEDPKITYTSWLGAMHNKYPWLELNSEKAGYDYERYFNENYDDAISRLNELESRHFTDKYKLPNHPTFSEESIYSQGPRYGGHWTDDNEFIPSVINQLQYPDIYLEYKPYSEGEIYGNGGSIHIKQENHGKFTALKKRTGHSASWFKEHGTPALKKMATFELNAKKWKHLLGGQNEVVNTLTSVINNSNRQPLHFTWSGLYDLFHNDSYDNNIIYGGGNFGKAGASGEWGDIDYIQNTPVPAVTRTFDDAFAEARRNGQSTFLFNGKLYNTEIDPNYNSNAGKYRQEVVSPALNIRKVYDSAGLEMDSTRVEPWVGLMPGWTEREYLDNKKKYTYIGSEPEWPNKESLGGHLFQGINNSKLAEINNAMHYSGGSHNPLEIIYNNNIMPSQNYYNGTHYPGQYISNIEELLPNGRDHINLYTYGDQNGFEKFNNPTPIIVNGQIYNYDLYNGNILPIDTLFLQKDITQPVIDSMIKNNDILGLNTDYFLVPANKDEYPTIYNNIYNYPNVDLNTVLDDTRNVSMSPKRDKNGNYYADVFDIIDFNNTLGVAGNYLDKQAKKAGAYGPYILRLHIPIKFTNSKSNGKMLGQLSSQNKNGKTWESLLLKYSKYYKQLRNNNQYPTIPKANGGQIIWDNIGLLNPKLKGKITGIIGTKQGTPITMENVDIDLIGQDNLGNMQYMTEGNNYFFPGEYVVEYPVNKHSRQYGGVVENTQNFIAPYLQDLVSRHPDNFTYLPQYMQDYVLKDAEYVNPNQYERPNQLLVNLVTPLSSTQKRSLSDYVNKDKLDYMQTVWDYLDKYNMSPYNRAALMGNIMLESGFNPKAKNPKSSAYGLFQMLDTPRNKAYKWMNQNNIIDKDLGLIDWYVHLMNDNIDEYMDEYNNFMSRWDKVRQQYELNPNSTNKKYMDLYQSYYDNTYKNRVDNNEMWSVLDLNNTWNNVNSSLGDRTRMFEIVFEKSGPGSEHLKRINSANDILDYFYPNHVVVDAMKQDPLNYIDGEFQYDEFGEPIKKQYGGLIKPFSYNTIPVVRF